MSLESCKRMLVDLEAMQDARRVLRMVVSDVNGVLTQADVDWLELAEARVRAWDVDPESIPVPSQR